MWAGWIGIVALAVLTIGLPATFPANGGPTWLDRTIATPIHTALDAHPGVFRALVVPSEGYIPIPLVLLGTLWFARRGQWRRAVTMVLAPGIAIALNALVLKPLWDRPLHDYLAYPSGHTVQLVAVATAFVLLTDSIRARTVALVGAVIAWVAAAIGMIGLDYHYPTDILGGAAAAIVMVAVCCAVAQTPFTMSRSHHDDAGADVRRNPRWR